MENAVDFEFRLSVFSDMAYSFDIAVIVNV